MVLVFGWGSATFNISWKSPRTRKKNNIYINIYICYKFWKIPHFSQLRGPSACHCSARMSSWHYTGLSFFSLCFDHPWICKPEGQRPDPLHNGTTKGNTQSSVKYLKDSISGEWGDQKILRGISFAPSLLAGSCAVSARVLRQGLCWGAA